MKTNFNTLLAQAPHKDITAINKFITSSCFTCTGQETLLFIRKTGYRYSLCDAVLYIKKVKEQFEEACSKFGGSVEVDFFCDVAGTKHFDDFMAVYDKDSFYQDMINYNPEFNYSGDLKKIHNRALRAVRDKDFQSYGEGIHNIMEALERALKKVGINPSEDINGTSKVIAATMQILEDIGGMQLYLPRSDALKRTVNKVDIYTDSYRMEPRQLAVKYGVTDKTVYLAIKYVKQAIKEYEGSNETI